jgi:predicted alpha/beta-fold hydrolase
VVFAAKVILHGLNGSSDDTYVRFLAALASAPGASGPDATDATSGGSAAADAASAQANGRRPPPPPLRRPAFRVAGYLMRGCGGLPLTTRRGYSAADTVDLAAALDQVRSTSRAVDRLRLGGIIIIFF